jgi:glycosyltransferase involved in cell wall biosynthesis
MHIETMAEPIDRVIGAGVIKEASMKICFLTELFPPSMGGQQQRFAELARLLAMHGHKVTVMCIRDTVEAAAEEKLANGVTVIRRPTLSHYYKPLGGLLPRSPLGMLRYALAARRLTQAQKFDVIFLNQWPLLHILSLSRRDRSRAIVDWCEIRHSKTFKIVQNVLPKLVAANTAVSAQVAQHIRYFARGRVLFLPSGITGACYRMHAAGSRAGVLYLGRITGHKNLTLLIDTFEELCRRGYEEKLTIAGDGPAFETVRRRVESSPCSSRIEPVGLVSDERKYELLAGARLLMMTSQREGFPRVVAEAMASGLPVVTARYPQNGTVGVVEDFQCGLCAEPTANDLADAAQTILDDWDAWSARSHRRAASLEWSSLIQQFEALLIDTAASAGNLSLVQQTQGASCESW